MNDSIKEKIKSWAALKNWGTPHPLDENRLYDVVIQSYQDNEHISFVEFKNVVLEYLGVTPDETALERSFHDYESGLQLLRYFKN